MKKIGDITNTADKNGEFTDGNVAAGTPPTQLMGAWFNSVQREILNVLVKAGVPQSATKEDQLAEAITKMIASAGYLPTGYSYSKVESDTRFQPKGNYATSEALKNGLDGKFDKKGGVVAGNLNVIGGYVQSEVLQMQRSDVAERLNLYPSLADNSLAFLQYNTIGGTWHGRIEIPKVAVGTVSKLMLVGDFGFGGSAKYEDLTEAQTIDKFKKGISQIWRGNITDTKYSFRYGPNFLAQSSDTFFNIAVGVVGGSVGRVRVTSGILNQDPSEYKVADLYSTLNTVVDRNGHLKALNYPDELSDYPIGSPIPWPQSTAPAGYLICNGNSFNKTTYPLLAKAYPSGVLPDLRAEFIRGADAGRNVDNGRNVLSAQSDENKEHDHNMILKNANGSGSSEQNALRTLAINVSNATYTTEKSGGKESRPRNIAFLYIVRAA